ncbi:hypothetical protein FrCorBMG51_07655 [Protofrankia coriariae]|uniref:Uncharacterized protein n=1 Tax=Protofrankia coriariae TaxID=1562887 RepID=A0ABR5F5F6_9ACTN|nr:hypothetical protein FrCorBMG51_07655 [Protofrankia coriariae]
MAAATVSGVPTRAVEAPAALVAEAVGVHSARSCRSPSRATRSSRWEPTLGGSFAPVARNAACASPLLPRRTSRIRWAFSQASSSVGAMIGRKVTQMRGVSSRPARRACSATASICSLVSLSGSPHRPKMSACAPPTW